MKKLLLVVVSSVILSGCCYNQYDRRGYSLGLDCVKPHKQKDKKCDPRDPQQQCQKQKVNPEPSELSSTS